MHLFVFTYDVYLWVFVFVCGMKQSSWLQVAACLAQLWWFNGSYWRITGSVWARLAVLSVATAVTEWSVLLQQTFTKRQKQIMKKSKFLYVLADKFHHNQLLWLVVKKKLRIQKWSTYKICCFIDISRYFWRNIHWKHWLVKHKRHDLMLTYLQCGYI